MQNLNYNKMYKKLSISILYNNHYQKDSSDSSMTKVDHIQYYTENKLFANEDKNQFLQAN